MRFRSFVLAFVLAGGLPVGTSALARAEAADVVGSVRAEVTRGEVADGELSRAQEKLAAQSARAAVEIDKLKTQPSNPTRDGRLQELLAQAQTRADEQARLEQAQHTLQAKLAQSRQELIRACDAQLAGPTAASLKDEVRVELTRLRATQVSALVQPARSVTMTSTTAQPLDGPRELEAKADLLRDSSDKLRREAKHLAVRVDDLERRRHLRERSSLVDEDWFSESTSNRRYARTATSATGDAAKAGGASDFATPANPATNGAPGGAGVAPVIETATVLRNLVDPATLEELRRADRGDDLDRQIRALRRAEGELDSLATDIDKKVKGLSRKAQELRNQK